jgi:type IV secretion system protein VirB9
MTYKSALAAALLLSSANAFAADNRIQTVKYDPDQVVKIVARPGVQSTIEFEDGERIENVAVGNSDAWQITPNRRASALFLKPLAKATATNMTVITDQRVYMFDLVARGSAGAPVYALRFQYPNPKPKAAEAPKMAEADAQSTPALAPAQLFFGWKMKGHKKLLPERVFDDGASLYLAWDGDTPLPAILTMSSDGKEGPINYRTSGEYIVIDPVPGAILLRQGNMEARVWRSAPVPRPAPVPYISPAPPRPDIVAAAPPPQQPNVLTRAAAPQVPAAAATSAAQLRTPDVRMLLTDQLSETANGK